MFLGNKKALLLHIKFFYRKSFSTFSIEKNSNSKISQLVPYLKYFTFATERRALKQEKTKEESKFSYLSRKEEMSQIHSAFLHVFRKSW